MEVLRPDDHVRTLNDRRRRRLAAQDGLACPDVPEDDEYTPPPSGSGSDDDPNVALLPCAPLVLLCAQSGRVLLRSAAWSLRRWRAARAGRGGGARRR